jgi:enoyl-[acyl-carrier protein] reductase II
MSVGIGHERLQRLMKRGTDFLGCEVAILGGAMSWISERNLVSALSNAGAFGVIASGAMTPDLLDTEIAEPGAHGQAVRRQPHHHAPAAFRADRRVHAPSVSHVVLAGGPSPRRSIDASRDRAPS